MKKLLLSTIAAVALFATAASANHVMFQIGYKFEDSVVSICPTEEAGLAIMKSRAEVDTITLDTLKAETLTNGCELHMEIVGTVNSILCKMVREDVGAFSLTTITLDGKTESNFAILYTDSESLLCGEQK